MSEDIKAIDKPLYHHKMIGEILAEAVLTDGRRAPNYLNGYEQACINTSNYIFKLESHNKLLKDALEKYADEKNWITGNNGLLGEHYTSLSGYKPAQQCLKSLLESDRRSCKAAWHEATRVIVEKVLEIIDKNIYDPRKDFCATNDMAELAAGMVSPAIYIESIDEIKALLKE